MWCDYKYEFIRLCKYDYQRWKLLFCKDLSGSVWIREIQKIEGRNFFPNSMIQLFFNTNPPFGPDCTNYFSNWRPSFPSHGLSIWNLKTALFQGESQPPPSDLCSVMETECRWCFSGFLSCGRAPESTTGTNWLPNPQRFQEAQTSLERIMTWQHGAALHYNYSPELGFSYAALRAFNLGLYGGKRLWRMLSPLRRDARKPHCEEIDRDRNEGCGGSSARKTIEVWMGGASRQT